MEFGLEILKVSKSLSKEKEIKPGNMFAINDWLFKRKNKSMRNLKLDIEDKLWAFVETEDAVHLFKNTLYNLPARDWADQEFEDCVQIVDPDNPFTKLCFEITASHNLKVDLKIFEASECKIKHVLGCTVGDDFIYFFYHPRLLKQLELSEISFLLMHELGHYYFRKNISPEKMATHNLYYLSFPPETDFNRFRAIAFLLSHISEYNSDRFAAFNTQDLQSYKKAMVKIFNVELAQNPNLNSIDECRKQIAMDWKNKFKSSHPLIDDRVSALDCIGEYVHDTNFDINKTPVVYNKMLELLSYNEFMQEYGEYYEERLKSINSQQMI